MKNDIICSRPKYHVFSKLLWVICLCLFIFSCSKQTTPTEQTRKTTSSLENEFESPPASSKPLTWFHAMSGNMSAEGITKDLEAIAAAGIGGTLLFNVTQGIPLGNVKFNSLQHIDLIGHMAKESQRLGLSFGMHNCDGWTSSGGPWVTPEHSMKRLSFNETIVDGGEVDIKLAQPSSILDYYKDVAVIAYPALKTEIEDQQNIPTITASDPNFDPTIITNNNVTDKSMISVGKGQSAWLQLSYQQPYTLRLVDMLLHQGRGLAVSLHTSDDGKRFTKVDDLKLIRPGKETYGFDQAFEGHTAKYFRLVSNKSINIKELRLSSTPTISNFTGRSSASRTDYQAFKHIGQALDSLVIKTSSIVNVTHDLQENGRLITTLPAGKWTIMRFGYTSTGAINIPASREGTGLEVDKFSKAAFQLHYDNYITNVINKVKMVAPNALHTLEIDSYEVGAQNWTHQYEQLFKEHFNYDLVPYLPLFAGKFVDSAEISEAVLWDTRDLNNQLITKNYYGYFTELANQDGIKTYIEPYGSGPFNELDVARHADLPMGEFWLDNNNFRIAASSSTANIYNKPIVSAEAFTQFPSNNWLFHPALGKTDGDKSWALGVNQHVFHRFAHQANIHVMPGMTMNRWGAHLDRTQPWWSGAAKAWFEYITRGQHLLRIGNAVSDVLWYLGDATPTVCPEKDPLSSLIPVTINYDCLNSEILQQLAFENGKFILPHGSQYKVLVLNNHHTLNYDSVKKIYQLAQQGAVIIGDPIQRLAGRNILQTEQLEFEAMVDFIWAQDTTYNIPIDVKTNHGHTGVVPELTIAKSTLIDWDSIYAKHDFTRDLNIDGIENFYFTHRKNAEYDIYFVYNESEAMRLIDGTFRVTGKIPELWDPQTGKTTKLGAFEKGTKHTRVAFRLAPKQSMFVVFSESADDVLPISPDAVVEQDIQVIMDKNLQFSIVTSVGFSDAQTHIKLGENIKHTVAATPTPLYLNGQWQLEFNQQYGVDGKYELAKLIDWRKHPSPKVQDYSGTAIYRQSFFVEPHYVKNNTQLELDLGKVSIAATVSINGQLVGTAWHKPYRLDITKWVKEGDNTLEVEVANLWVNRLLADRKLPDTSGFKIARWQDPITKMPSWYTDNLPPPESKRMTFTTQRFMGDEEPSQTSGLLGPVYIKPFQIVPVDNLVNKSH